MSYFLAVSGSPSKLSRNNFLLPSIIDRIASYEIELRTSHAIELEPFAPDASSRLADLVKTVHDAQGIVLITPVPSEDWTGCMKSLLQFLPAGAFQHSPVLLIGTGGFINELPDLEKSLTREITRLHGHLALSSIHIGPKNWVFSISQPPCLTAGTESRLARALDRLHTLADQSGAVSIAA
jgi:FMN reductase